jgi:hypothetical protein
VNGRLFGKVRVGVGELEIAGDARVRWERVVGGDGYSSGKPWYHHLMGLSLHPTIRMENPLSRNAKLDSVIRINQEFPG